MSRTSSAWNPKIVARSLRICTGLILLAFVTTHLLNASLGILSLQAMDAGSDYLTGVWNLPPLGAILALSLLVHFVLGLVSIYQRPTLRTNAQDMVQLVTAVLVVPVMATHVLGISMSGNFGVHFDYATTIRLMWIDAPGIGLLQVIVVTIVWLHGCAGLLVWLRSLERARNLILWIYPLAIAVPVLSLLGFSEAGRHVLEAAANPGTSQYALPAMPDMSGVDFDLIGDVTFWTIWGSLGLAVLTLLARWARLALNPTQHMVLVRDGAELASQKSGISVLDGFTAQNVPHASLCLGRGRCGTCAVRVLASEYPLPPPTELERQTLLKRGLPEDARLACQLLPDGGRVEVSALYPADYTYRSLDDEPESAETQAGVTP